MPLYVHRDQVSGKKVEILRPFDLYRDPPTEEEAVSQGLTEEEARAAVWEKILGTGIKVIRGEGWGPGRKGYW